MDRKVKVRPDQACRIRELAYLADGTDQLQLSELRTYKAWKDFFFQCLCEMEEEGVLKSIQTYPLGVLDESGEIESMGNLKSACNRQDAQGLVQTMKICPVLRLIRRLKYGQPRSDNPSMQDWKDFFLRVLFELEQDGLIKPVQTSTSGIGEESMHKIPKKRR